MALGMLENVISEKRKASSCNLLHKDKDSSCFFGSLIKIDLPRLSSFPATDKSSGVAGDFISTPTMRRQKNSNISYQKKIIEKMCLQKFMMLLKRICI
ncbi:hypothetical protein CEXT_742581 [Caerostris extrusa]|uniref:Ycf15 n=1 Tax=Caerostris extrusa TaxID=172846 RepID=A0AAV4RVQ7_CAEEX|nr:hypothetical protein CEXT_742581 [Caerostris extrusa]